MRRVIAGISNFTDVGDISTLANPDVVEKIKEQVEAAKKERGEDQQELSKEEQKEIAEFGAKSE
jgi:acetyl-CoA synthetase